MQQEHILPIGHWSPVQISQSHMLTRRYRLFPTNQSLTPEILVRKIIIGQCLARPCTVRSVIRLDGLPKSNEQKKGKQGMGDHLTLIRVIAGHFHTDLKRSEGGCVFIWSMVFFTGIEYS